MRRMAEQDDKSGSGMDPARQERLGLANGDFYLSPEGYIIFTEQYHLKRGHCCQSGCRHCPYGFNKPLKRKD